MPHKMMNSQIADVLHDNRLSIEARMLYAYLCSFDDSVPPSTYQMIRQLGIGKTRFYRYRNELEAFGLIEVENKITSGGGVQCAERGCLREIQYPVWIPMRPDNRCHAVRYDAHSD